MPEAGAGTQGHGLSGSRFELFYGQAVNGSTLRRSNGPRRRKYACSAGLIPGVTWRNLV